MKKLLIVAVILIICVLFLTNGFVNLTSYLQGDYTFYNKTFANTYLVSQTVSLTFQKPLEAQIERLKLQNVRGESVKIQGSDRDIEDFIKKARITIVYSQEVSGASVLYGYTYRLRGAVVLDGQKVNIQIAKRQNTITIGTPLIFGSF